MRFPAFYLKTISAVSNRWAEGAAQYSRSSFKIGLLGRIYLNESIVVINIVR